MGWQDRNLCKIPRIFRHNPPSQGQSWRGAQPQSDAQRCWALLGLWSRGDPAPLYPKTGHFRENQPQNCCLLQKVELGKWGGQEGAPARGGSRGGPGREGVALRCCGLSEGKVGWRERREEGMEEGEGSPREGKGLCPLRSGTQAHLLGQAGRRRMEAAWPSWREERKIGISWMRPPEVRIWDRSSLSHGWAAAQGARRGVRAQGGAGKEHPNSNQRGLGMLRVAAKCPELAHRGPLQCPVQP